MGQDRKSESKKTGGRKSESKKTGGQKTICQRQKKLIKDRMGFLDTYFGLLIFGLLFQLRLKAKSIRKKYKIII